MRGVADGWLAIGRGIAGCPINGVIARAAKQSAGAQRSNLPKHSESNNPERSDAISRSVAEAISPRVARHLQEIASLRQQ